MAASVVCGFTGRSKTNHQDRKEHKDLLFSFVSSCLSGENDQLSNGLNQLNSLLHTQAEAEFLKCCGSQRWASAMTGARPFANVDDLLTKADSIWQSLRSEDWLEAFRAHPEIGEKKAAAAQSEEARKWSAQEQSGTQGAAADTMAALAEGNRDYERRFGFIFIVCATGKSSEEMLAILQARLRNDAETEIAMAAEEQRKITRLRLEKLLQQ
jgi:OHCU decarboxylase